MSLFDSASLVVTPSGYKEDKLYSIKPTDGSGDLVVTRATTATRVNSDGLIEQVPYNLLTYSEQFDNSIWTKANATISANAIISPNGSLTADKLIEDTANSSHYFRSDFILVNSGSSYTYSIFAKKAERNFTLLFDSYINSGYWFDLNNGIVGTKYGTGAVTANIQNFGNGWYKCSITFTAHSGGYALLFNNVTNADNVVSYTGNGTSGIYVYGAQLNSGTSAKEYFPTTDRLNVPRLDYTNSSCPSILVEPQRTNLILRSQEFDNASWTKAGVNVTANNTISPTGLTDAELLTTSTSGAVGMYQLISTGSGTFSFSVFAKKGNNNYFAINIQANSTNNCTAVFDLSDGTLGEYQTEGSTSYINHKIESYGNGWYRCTIVFSTTSNPYFFPMFAPLKTGNSFTSSGEVNGNTSGKTLYLFGAQLEAGSYATSYIPTIASSVTRNADVISKTGLITNNFLSASGGTWFVDLSDIQYISGAISFYIGDGGSNLLTFGGDFGTKYLRVWLYNSGTSTNLYSFPFAQRQKIAFSFTLSQLKIFVNGVLVVTRNASLNCNLWTNFLNDNTSFSCRQNSMMFFNTQLTDAECINLTTL